MKEVVIVAACRTAIGSFGGVSSSVTAIDLGTSVVKGLLKKVNLNPKNVDEVILGQVLTAGCGQNPARQVAIRSEIPKERPAITVNRVCGSGLSSVILGVQSIRCNDADIIIAGGQESMDMAPHLLMGSRNGIKMGDWKMSDHMIKDGLTESFNDYHMGVTAENIAEKWKITRDEQDAFALDSQRKSRIALDSEKFKDEIVPVMVPQKKGEPIAFQKDDYPKPNTTIEMLSKLKPAFKKDGTVTAGNSSGINNGAAAVILMSLEKAKHLGLAPLARIVSYATVGVAPEIMGTGPIYASKLALQKASWTVNELDLIEANEAFAAQAICVNKEMGWDLSKVNVNGGAIALGHPIGASGARILVTLIHEMLKRKVQKGIATLCVGGGMGVAVTIEA